MTFCCYFIFLNKVRTSTLIGFTLRATIGDESQHKKLMYYVSPVTQDNARRCTAAGREAQVI